MKLLLVFQEALGVERRHAARGGGGDGLTVGLVLHVACGEDALQLITVQPEGKPRMSAPDWLRGARLQPGDHLG